MSKKILSFEDRVKRGDYVPLKKVAKTVDYNEQHLQRLCKAAKVECFIYRGDYFFTPEQVEKLTRPVRVHAVAQKRRLVAYLDRETVWDDGSTQEPCPKRCGAYLSWETGWDRELRATSRRLVCPNRKCRHVIGRTTKEKVGDAKCLTKF